MRISERKHRLRARGIVPVSQLPAQVTRSATTTRERAAPGGKAAAPQGKPRQRRPLSPRYQIIFGAAYMVFAPILLLQYITLLHAPKSKVHPDVIQLILPVIFFLFGAWWVYRGMQARRRDRMQALEAGNSQKPVASSSQKPVASSSQKVR